MAEDLNVILNELRVIRSYLIKIGPSRRHGKILDIKRKEANSSLLKYNQFVKIYKENLRHFTNSEILLITRICEEFDKLYSEIICWCSDTREGELSLQTMADIFEIKTALHLLPVMDDSSDNTKQLIESIEYYDSVLDKPGCKIKLIQFVLKNRLSQRAKLLLSSKYETVDELIKDMRKLLLPQKSYISIQTKLQNCKQYNKTVTDYGKEISELFVNLTISQAESDSAKYALLKPMNEKLAIKRFADGLRDRRLSTIIASRNCSSLTEAIQTAQDEETPGPSGSAEMIGTYKHSFYQTKRAQRGYRGQRNFAARSGHQGYQQRGHRPQVPHKFSNKYFRGNYNNNFRESNGFPRGNRNRGIALQRNMNFMTGNRQVATETSTNESLNHFFRE